MADVWPAAGTGPVTVRIHPSQFPGAVEAALVASIEGRRMAHRFHYDTPKQALRWLRIHEAYSPARRDPSCERAYQAACAAAAAVWPSAPGAGVLGLGCGGGQKEAGVVAALRAAGPGRDVRYVPVDVSSSLVLIAREAALQAGITAGDCLPEVMDLAVEADWAGALQAVWRPGSGGIVTFFGMLPNLAPAVTLRRLSALVGRGDVLLLSANLAPGADYRAGVEAVLPGYDNAATRDWLFCVLGDLGVAAEDGRIEFRVAECPEGTGLLRIEADFVFRRASQIGLTGREWRFQAGDRFGLFYSYRHTPARVRALFAARGLEVGGEWLNDAGDEGVFLLRRP